MYFYYNSASVWINPSSTVIYSNASFIPYFYNGTNYDFENGMSSNRTLDNNYTYFNSMGITFPTSKRLWGTTNTYRNGYRLGYPALLTSKNEIEGLTPLPTVSISGKYRIPSAVGTGYSLPFSTVKVKCYFNDEYYDYIAFTTGKEYSVNGYQSENFGNNYTALGFIKADNSNSLSLHITSWDNYVNQIIDFGETPQIVPAEFKAFFDNNFDYIYPYSYTVKSSNGLSTLASITEAPSIVGAMITQVGEQKTLKLKGSNDVEYVLSWLSDTPEGKTFLGLSNALNSNRVILPIGVYSSVLWRGDFVLYESYGAYQPPATTFDINLYQNTAEPDRVDKTEYLTKLDMLNGVMRESSSITDLSLTVEMFRVPDFNYAYIPIFNRYYFVTDITSIRYGLWEISFSVDVLMSYKDAIKNLYAFVDRNEFINHSDIIDEKRVIEQGYDVEDIELNNAVFDRNKFGCYLITGLGFEAANIEE